MTPTTRPMVLVETDQHNNTVQRHIFGHNWALLLPNTADSPVINTQFKCPKTVSCKDVICVQESYEFK